MRVRVNSAHARLKWIELTLTYSRIDSYWGLIMKVPLAIILRDNL